MVLYQSSLITLDYDPASDILSVDWPDVQELYIPEVEKEISVLIDTIKHYDVKKLLIDTSKAKVEINTMQYQEFLTAFAKALMQTRLRKFARIGAKDPEREKVVNQAKEASNITQSMEFRVFPSKDEAMEWLMI